MATWYFRDREELKCTIWRQCWANSTSFLDDFESIACLASEQKLIESHVILTGCNDSDFINLGGSIHTHNGLTAKSKGYFMLTK